MNENWRTLICLLGLLVLVFGVVQGATPCPSDCTCLSPAAALKMGYKTYCGGKQIICDYDMAQNPLYCYQKSTTTNPDFEPIGTTTTPAQQCPAGCLCAREEDAKAKGLVYCGGKQILCGHDTSQKALYCYEKVATTTSTPVSQYIKCPINSMCYIPKQAEIQNLQMLPNVPEPCGYDEAEKTEMFCYQKRTPTTTPTTYPPVISPIPFTTTPSSSLTAPIYPYIRCPLSCSCWARTEASEWEFAPCENVAAPCGYSEEYHEQMFCYHAVIPQVLTTTIVPIFTPAIIVERNTPIPDAVACRSNYSCLDEATIRERGYVMSSDTPPACGYSKTQGVMYCAQSTDGQQISSSHTEEGIVTMVYNFFMSLLGRPVETPLSPQPYVYIDYCHSRYGLDSCNGYCVNLSIDEDHCGRCGTACYEDEICCDGICLRNTSTVNCGRCGNICPSGTVCQFGRCDEWGCYYGNVPCDGICVNTNSDPENCGSCGNRCPANTECVEGVCRLCPLNTLSCDGRCVHSESDRENCGACRNTCSEDAICGDGSCITCSGFIPTRCGNACINLVGDDNNCGTCGYVCPEGTYCSAAECQCFGYERGIQWCPTLPIGTGVCVDTMNDPDNCGGCGGLALHRCDDTEVCCEGVCVDLTTDRSNCGSCGNACDENAIQGAGFCRAGTCTFCDEGYRGCEAESGYISCVNIWTSPNNCGGCGRRCAEGEICCIGECIDPQTDDEHCGSCSTPCLTSEDCCDGTCTDVWYNDDNCGGCGHHCIRPDRDHCTMGKCCNAIGTNCEPPP